MATWVGIDVSKATLDLGWECEGRKCHKQFPNTKKGFQGILEAVPGDANFLMEATGTYYFNVALHLHREGKHVAVVNPVRIKNHMRAEMSRTKSDKADAHSIARYGRERQPSAWEPPSREAAQIQQLLAADLMLTGAMTKCFNMMEAFKCTEYYSPDAIVLLHETRQALKAKRKAIQEELERISQESMGRTIEVLASMPGVGRASAIRMAACVGDFKRFDSSRKLVSFLGLSPMTKQSGTSVKSRGHISRMGGTKVRGVLYMCAMNALQKNDSCKRLWERFKEHKKHGKIAMIAIMNKMIRQMYSMVINDRLYDPSMA